MSRDESEREKQQLVVDDDGLHVPEWLVGFVGEFQMRTPNVEGDLETTDDGLPPVVGPLGAYPEEGDYHEDLDEGEMALSTPEHDEVVYQIIDQRTEDSYA